MSRLYHIGARDSIGVPQEPDELKHKVFGKDWKNETLYLDDDESYYCIDDELVRTDELEEFIEDRYGSPVTVYEIAEIEGVLYD